MAKEVNARDAKLIQYLNEAYGKEKQLETALQAHITLTTRPPYKKRLQQHLKETKAHAKLLERRVKKLGGTADAGADMPGPRARQSPTRRPAVAAAQGPLHALRGTGEAEKMLKNAKDEYHEEAEEIANYTAIEALAELVGDKETAKVAKDIQREEERMQKFLEKLIPQLTKAVAQEEIPAAERKPAKPRRRSSSRPRARRSSSSTERAAKSSHGRRGRGTRASRPPLAQEAASRSAAGSAARAPHVVAVALDPPCARALAAGHAVGQLRARETSAAWSSAA